MRAESPYSQTPQLITAFLPEYKTEHYHLHGRNIQNWESFKSIFLDEHWQVRKAALKIFKGVAIGLLQGYTLRNLVFRGPKAFEMDRLFVLNQGNPNYGSLRGYGTFGGVMGFAWYVIKDVICLPHGKDTFQGYVLACGLMGGLLISTIYHPVNFFYGFVAGAASGGLAEQLRHRNLPKNFALNMKFTDEDKRRKLLREDEEYELSRRNAVIHKTNFYPL